MATTQVPVPPLVNGTHTTTSPSTPTQLAIPIPNSLGTNLHLHITNASHSLLLFIATRNEAETSAGPASLGSFVYAMPDLSAISTISNAGSNGTPPARRQPLATALYSRTQTLDFTTRLAKVLAAKVGKPVYVGGDVGFSGMGRGGDVEEEMVVFRAAVEAVVGCVQRGE